jgi:hypothetical protein
MDGTTGSLTLVELREAVRSIVETVVESMYKNHRLASSHPFGGGGKGCAKSGLIKVLGRYGHVGGPARGQTITNPTEWLRARALEEYIPWRTNRLRRFSAE